MHVELSEKPTPYLRLPNKNKVFWLNLSMVLEFPATPAILIDFNILKDLPLSAVANTEIKDCVYEFDEIHSIKYTNIPPIPMPEHFSVSPEQYIKNIIIDKIKCFKTIDCSTEMILSLDKILNYALFDNPTISIKKNFQPFFDNYDIQAQQYLLNKTLPVRKSKIFKDDAFKI